MSSLFVKYGIMKGIKARGENPYVTFEREGGTAIAVTPKWIQSDVEIQYSFDTETWSDATSGTQISNTTGNVIYFRGKAPTTKTLFTGRSDTNAWTCSTTTKIIGNLNFLLCDDLGDITAPTDLGSSAFAYMFYGCTSLVKAPNLPAETLAPGCYQYMFYGCTSLVKAPDLPATGAASQCYNSMFSGCTSLVTAPELPAETLGYGCYANMFSGCTSLVTAPELPAETLSSYCYAYMFKDCTSLVNAPELPATTLSHRPTPIAPLAGIYCYQYMFEGCTSLVTAPTLPATSLSTDCYQYMFSGCTSLTSITMYYTGTTLSYTVGWVTGITTTGTLCKDGTQYSSSGNNTYPSTWTQIAI